MNLFFRTSLLILATSATSAGALKPGDSAPDWTLRDRSGAEVKLSLYRGKKLVVILEGKPGVIEKTAPSNPAGLEQLSAAALFSAHNSDLDGNATVLVDRDGILRRIVPDRVLTGADLVNFVKQWTDGRAVFLVKCSRCHGEEGDSALCTEVKQLTGVGRRMTADQLRQAMRPGYLGPDQILIRDQFFTRADFEAVLAYVAGL